MGLLPPVLIEVFYEGGLTIGPKRGKRKKDMVDEGKDVFRGKDWGLNGAVDESSS